MAGRSRDRSSWIRFSSLGIEFVAAVVGFALLGFWIDHHYGCGPWGTVIGAGLGVVGGTYNTIRASMAAFKELEKNSRDGDEHRPKP